MEVNCPAFEPEIVKILNTPETSVHFEWVVQVITRAGVVTPLQLLSIDIDQNFESNYADRTVVRLAFGYGTYAHDIVPYKNDLKVSMRRINLGQRNGLSVSDELDVVETFRATLMGATQELTAPKNSVVDDKASADLVGIRYAEFQLQDLALEQIRALSVGSSFRNVVPGDVLKALLTNACKDIKIDNQLAINGVEMMGYNNRETFDHVIVPHGTPLVDVPDYIQSKAGGVYSTGLGFYLSRGWWYVWGLYDLTRHDRVPKSITVMVLPPNYLNGVERTYRVTPNQVIILATGESRHVDISEDQLLNEGNAVRYADPRKLISGFVSVDGNKAMADRATNANEFVGVEKPSGPVYARLAPEGATRNTYHQASKLAKRNGSLMMVTWQNSDPRLVIPNVPVNVMYVKDDLPVTIKGTLLGMQTYISGLQPGVSNRLYQSNTVFKLFVEKELPDWSD